MATDDDTTPVALRAALLRRDTTSARPKKTAKSRVLRIVIAFICIASLAWHLCTFENAADLRFFGGIATFLDFWLAVAAVHGAANATVLELPCDQI